MAKKQVITKTRQPREGAVIHQTLAGQSYEIPTSLLKVYQSRSEAITTITNAQEYLMQSGIHYDASTDAHLTRVSNSLKLALDRLVESQGRSLDGFKFPNGSTRNDYTRSSRGHKARGRSPSIHIR